MLTALLITCFLLAACSTLEEPQQQEKNTAVQADSSTAAARKFSAYMELDLFTASKLNETASFYFRNFGAGEELDVIGKSVAYTGIFLKINNYPLKGIEELAKSEPPIEKVDALAAELTPKLNELISLYGEADTYYLMKNYADDDYSKGKALHQQILTLHKEIAPLTDEYSQALSEQLVPWLKTTAESLGSNHEVEASVIHTVINAIALDTLLAKQGQAAGMDQLVAAQFKVLYNQLDEAIKALLDLTKDTALLEKEKLDEWLVGDNKLRLAVIEGKAAATDINQSLLQKTQASGTGNKDKDGNAEAAVQIQKYRISAKKMFTAYMEYFNKADRSR
ncbi:DUF3829 domain-containing protein [Paenibacillus sp. NPDC058174]|uniref:DUF3829 domain-containing protein n=1 Tax=Paenibacillus sp. NPDC058174 TaxID=3346366 RepID=UPI0036DD9DB4